MSARSVLAPLAGPPAASDVDSPFSLDGRSASLGPLGAGPTLSLALYSTEDTAFRALGVAAASPFAALPMGATITIVGTGFSGESLPRARILASFWASQPRLASHCIRILALYTNPPTSPQTLLGGWRRSGPRHNTSRSILF